MIDRSARNEAIAAMEDFLDGRITAFAFDERIEGIVTKDPTVNIVCEEAWHYYDDRSDHLVSLTKPEWDYFQRLLLVLRSDASLVVSRTKVPWRGDHVFALGALLAFAALAIYAGWGLPLYAVALPFGVICWIIDRYRRRFEPLVDRVELTRGPFVSFTQIRTLLRQVPDFTKRRYRPETGERVIARGILLRFAVSIRSLCACLCLPVAVPLVLLYQGIPWSEPVRISLSLPGDPPPPAR